MQDRFKFRAWDTEEGRYASDEDICFDTGGSCDNVYDLVVVDDQFYIYEQCTGLKDKNGKLIYEGDILQNGNFIRRVVYAEGQFRVVGCRDCIPLYLCNNDLEIVGNIHENLELLEDNE